MVVSSKRQDAYGVYYVHEGPRTRLPTAHICSISGDFQSRYGMPAVTSLSSAVDGHVTWSHHRPQICDHAARRATGRPAGMTILWSRDSSKETPEGVFIAGEEAVRRLDRTNEGALC